MADKEKPKGNVFYDQYDLENYLKEHFGVDASDFFWDLYRSHEWMHDKLVTVCFPELSWDREKDAGRMVVAALLQQEFGDEIYMKVS